LTVHEELVLKISVERNGKPDLEKSKIMRVCGFRSRFAQKGVGTFRVQQDSKDGWYFDLDSGGCYGLLYDAKGEHKMGGASLEKSTGKEAVIFDWVSARNDLHIKINAKIKPIAKTYGSPILEPLETPAKEE
jgi:hypothetical protein